MQTLELINEDIYVEDVKKINNLPDLMEYIETPRRGRPMNDITKTALIAVYSNLYNKADNVLRDAFHYPVCVKIHKSQLSVNSAMNNRPMWTLNVYRWLSNNSDYTLHSSLLPLSGYPAHMELRMWLAPKKINRTKA
jgi:hypothetical protein